MLHCCVKDPCYFAVLQAVLLLPVGASHSLLSNYHTQVRLAGLWALPFNPGRLHCPCVQVFGAAALALADLRIVKDPSFRGVSVTAERWVPLLQARCCPILPFISPAARLLQCVLSAACKSGVLYNQHGVLLLQVPERELLPWLRHKRSQGYTCALSLYMLLYLTTS